MTLGDLAHDAEPQAEALARTSTPARTVRTPPADRSGAMPGPWSVDSRSWPGRPAGRSNNVTVDPAGARRTALAARLVTAWRRAAASPCTTTGSPATARWRPRWAGRGRRTRPPPPGPARPGRRGAHHRPGAPCCGPGPADRRRVWLIRPFDSWAIGPSGAGRRPWPRGRRGPRSRLVRSTASGLRSSWEASWMKRRCCSNGVVEPVEHLVERVGQVASARRRGPRRLMRRGQVGGLDVAGHPGDPADRPQRPPASEPARCRS